MRTWVEIPSTHVRSQVWKCEPVILAWEDKDRRIHRAHTHTHTQRVKRDLRRRHRQKRH